MSHLETLIPYGLPPAELASDLLRELRAPSLASLISRSSSASGASRSVAIEEFSRALPHEAWLARRLGLGKALEHGGSPPVAPLLMQALNLPPQDGHWFVVQPVHIHIARDHLVLTDPATLDLAEDEARTLFDIAASLFAEAEMPLLYGDRATWFLRADDWSGLRTSSTDAASGHNIDIWMPKGPHERDWRKIQNEIQMHWFDHAVNREREGQGRKAINSVWLWGGADAAATAETAFTHAWGLSGWMRAYGRFAAVASLEASAAKVVAARPSAGLALLDTLRQAALTNDWAQWLANQQALETEWFAPLLEALKSGALDRLTLVLSNDVLLSQFTVTRSSLRKFWIAPSLSKLSP